MSVPFNDKAQSWKEKVISGDSLSSQVANVLSSRGLSLPTTPRRPDVRLIVENISGTPKIFRNPGNHGDKAEVIPADGADTAAMVMVKGDTLAEQQENARKLVERYNLDDEGLSDSFVEALVSGDALDLVAEAYGPAPFSSQVGRLETVNWESSDETETVVKPEYGAACAYGARPPTDEVAFRTDFQVFINGTGTVPEKIESEGMVVAVSEDWQTGATTTRPIVPSVARDFYGKYYDDMPVAKVHPDGYITGIDLGNGQVIDLSGPVGADGQKFDLGS